MKNVWIFVMSSLLWGGTVFAQDLQNANWYFGNQAGITFMPSGTSTSPLSGSAMNTNEGCATISDVNGNLLFYTNGVTVWKSNHLPMLNGTGLYGHSSSTQSAVIVPKPGDSSRYYIVTINGATGTKQGLYYSEVDMDLGGGLGDIVTGKKNLVLQDHLGININSSYNNASEKLTVTKNSNGVDYWVLTQIKGYAYTYAVTSTNIAFSSFVSAPVTILNGASNYHAATGEMKVSANGKRIGICYTNANGMSAPGAIALGSFNNTTGEVIFDSNIISINEGVYGLEFSPNSSIVYFTAGGNNLYYTLSSSSAIQSIYVYEPNQVLEGLQRGINNKVYAANYGALGKLSVINDPNNYSNPDLQFLTVNATGTTLLGLPQWTYSQNSCEIEITLDITDNVTDMDYRQASDKITASNIIYSNGDAVYHAGNTVLLTNGFHSQNASFFHGYIEGCSDNSGGRIGQFEDDNEKDNSLFSESELSFFTLAPNPANSIVTITATEEMKSVTITSQDGKTLYSRAMPDKTTGIDIPVSSYSDGIYTVTVTTANGKIQTQKLVKN